MSETSSLTELANFVAGSRLAAEDAGAQRRAVNAVVTRLSPPIRKRGVGELLGAVLALSARTRRMMLPRVAIDLDVFGPAGARAVRVILPRLS
jgi:hypothetical protein